MRRSIYLILVLSVTLTGFGQGQIYDELFVTQKVAGIDSNAIKVSFIYNAGHDTLFLNAVCGETQLLSKSGFYDDGSDQGYAITSDSTNTSVPIGSVTNSTNYFICSEDEVQLVDSIDFNDDGIKELVLLRAWNCSFGPKSSLMNEFGVGGQQERSACYEIWDVTTKQQLAALNFFTETTIIVSTNVVWSHGYRYEVEFNRNGTITLTNISGIVDDPKEGTYKYDSKLGMFNKIRS